MIFEMSLESEKSEKFVTNPMEYDFGEISSISKVTYENLISNDEISRESEVLSADEIIKLTDIKNEPRKKPSFFSDVMWNEYQESYPWLYHSGKRFLCSYCENAFKKVESMVPTDWTRGNIPGLPSEQSDKYFSSRKRFDRHSNSKNHILAFNYINQSSESIAWHSLKCKYDWLDGDIENTRCLFCEEAYKRHKSIMIVTIWTCPELKNQQSPTHFSITHRLDRHEKCKNHLLAVQLQNNSEKSNTSTPVPRLSVTSNTPSKSLSTTLKRNRKSVPARSHKQTDIVLPMSINNENFRTLKLRYPWLLNNNEISFSCEICPKSDCNIVFDSDSSLSMISRRILAHCHSDAHSEATQKHSEGTCVTRLQRGVVHKIDYKRLSSGIDDLVSPASSGTILKRPTNRFSCPQCNSHFIQSTSLIEHISLCDYHSKSSIRELSCPCNPPVQIFNTITKLDLHAVQEHSDQKLFSCYICSDRFNRLISLYDHMIVNHLIDWDPFETYMPAPPSELYHQCIFCCATLNSNTDLLHHYSRSKCKKYLQPTVIIEKLNTTQLEEESKNIGIYDADTSRNEDSKSPSLDEISDGINDTSEVAPHENQSKAKSRTNLFSQIFSDIIVPASGEEFKKTKVTEKEKICLNKVTDKRNVVQTKSSHENVQLKWLPKTKSSLNLFSRNSTESSNVIKKADKEIRNTKALESLYQKKSERSQLTSKVVKTDNKYQHNRTDDRSKKSIRSKNIDSAKQSKSEPVKNIPVKPDIQQKLFKKRHCRSIFSRRAVEVEEIVPKKSAQGSLKTINQLNILSKKLPNTDKQRNSLRSHKKSTIIERKKGDIKKITKKPSVDSVSIKNETLPDDNMEPNDSKKSISPNKKVQSLYLDKLKEMNPKLNYELSDDKSVVKICSESPNKDKCIETRKSLFDQTLSDIGITVSCDEEKEKLESDISSSFKEILQDKILSSPDKSIVNFLSGKSISSPNISYDTTKKISSAEKSETNNELFSPDNIVEMGLNKTTVDLNKNYEIISLNLVQQSETHDDINTNETEETSVKTPHACTEEPSLNTPHEYSEEKPEIVLPDSTENELNQNKDKSIEAYCEGITLAELKVCIEKTDLVEEQKRLKTMIEKRKRNTLDQLRQDLSEKETSIGNEKRVRIPTEKLRENANFVDQIRDRRRVPVERKSRKDDTIIERNKVKNLKEKESTKTSNLFNTTRKRKLPLNIRQPNYLTSKESRDGSIKSESKISNISKVHDETDVIKPSSEQSKFPKLTSLIIESAELGTCSPSPDIFRGKKPIMIQSQLSPPCKSGNGDIQDEQNIHGEMSFMDRMKKIRQLKKIRTEQQREQMMAVDRTVAEINEKATTDSTIIAKSDKIQKLLTCDQYSMSDLKNILHDECEKRKLAEVNVSENIPKPPACKQYSMADLKNILQDECKKRKLTDMDEYKSPKKAKLDSSVIELPAMHSVGHLLCEICHLTFRSLRARDKHVVEEHKGLKLFKCNVCELSLTTHLSLRKHANKHHPDNVASIMSGTEINKTKNSYFQCHFCSVQCISRTGLQNHITSVHRANQSKQRSSNESDLPVSFPVVVVDSFVSKLKDANPVSYYQECPICSEVVNNDFELAIHTVEHERENDSNLEANQFACPKCCRLFFGREGKTYLKDHYNIIHLQKPVPSCDECNTEFPSTWCYYEHKRTQRNCAKKTAEEMTLSADPYEPLNDPMRLAFVCSRCQTLVAGDSAQIRFDQHLVECSLQMTDMDGGDEMDVHVEEEEEEEESLVVDDSAVTVVAVGGTLVARDHC